MTRIYSEKEKKGFKGFVRSLLKAANFKISPEKFIIMTLLYGLAISSAVFVIMLLLLKFNYFASTLAYFISFAIVNGTAYAWVSLVADSRSRSIVQSLPDALHYISTQVRAGMTVDKAILLAAKPEFGPLQEELVKVSNDVLSGEPLDDALLSSADRVKSPLYAKTIDLLVSGIRSGGQLAKILDHTANDIQNQLLLQKEIAANVGMQANFIFFAATLGAPMLLGLSSFISQILASKLSNPAGLAALESSQVQIPFNVGGSPIPSDFIYYFALTSIIVTNFFAALVIGTIKFGKEKQGIKYIPALIIMALVLFFTIRYFMAQTFSELL